MENIKRPSISKTNLFYLLLAICILAIGSLVQSREIYSGLLITEYLLVLLPSLIFIKSQGLSLKKSLRLNRLGLRNTLLVILIPFFAYPVVVFIQAIFIRILATYGEINPSEVPAPMDQAQLLYSFFVIALSPGICEELMFRGAIMSAYDKLGARKSIIITAILFGVFHFTILNFIGPTILGILFGIMVHKTNSIYASIIAHTINNGIAVTILFYLNKYSHIIDKLDSQPVPMDTEFGKAMFSLLLIIVISTFFVIRLMKGLRDATKKDPYMDYNQDRGPENYLDRSPGTNEVQGSELVYESDIEAGRKGGSILQYLPLLLVLIIFILVNWKFILV